MVLSMTKGCDTLVYVCLHAIVHPTQKLQKYEMKIITIVAACLLLLSTASPAHAQNSPDEIIGVPWVGEKGVSETVASIMAREALAAPTRSKEPRLMVEREEVERDDLPQNPFSKDVARWPEQSGLLQKELPGFGPQTVGMSFTGATLSVSAYPPDDMGAVGPTQYVVAVNSRIRTYSKATGAMDGVLNADMDVFFTSVMTPPTSTNFTSDPRVRYDRMTGKWIVIIIDVPGGNGALPNRVLFAVSNTSTITASTVWTYFYFQQDLVTPTGNTGQFADYPTLGVDANALYIGANMFTAAGSFSNTSAWVVRKSSIMGAGPIVVTAFRNLLVSNVGPYTPQGVDNFDPAATEGYFVGTDNASFGTLMIRRVSNPGGTPTISSNISLTVPTTSSPSTVRHLGNTGGSNGYLDAIDDRLYAAVMRNGRLWTAHTIYTNNTGAASGTKTRDAVRWYEIQNLTGTPSLVQSGTVYASTTTNNVDSVNYWFPTIMVSGQGHAAMVFCAAGTQARVNAGTVGRLSGDALGTMGSPLLYTASTTAYNPSGDPGGSGGRRWGDYSYVSLDPNDDMTMWAIGQFCDATNSYGCRVVQLLAPPPATPASTSPASIASGLPSVTVTLTGTQSSGSGFYDPGTGFPNRIAATLTGGVTVNSITYVNPTTVTLDLNTTGATVGTKNVTITNPDGQVRTGTGILNVVAGGPNITVTGPNGGESWPIGSTQAITWTSNSVTGNVTIDLSTDGGVTFPGSIAANTANDGTETWTVSGSATTLARVRVVSITDPTIRDSSNANFTLLQPSITVTSPNGGESWIIGSSQTITWTSANMTGNVKIEESTDGGATFPIVLAASTANDGTEAWTVAGPATGSARIRITSLTYPAVLDQSNANAAIVQATLTVTSPNGGEIWSGGSSQSILWSSSNLTGNVKIDLSLDGGATFPTVIAASTANDGSEAWTVPATGTASARIRVASVAIPAIADTSNANFTILQPAIAVTSPNGGETWGVGTAQAIHWTSVAISGNVKIELSRDGGSTYETLFASTTNDGVENWTVTGTPTTNGLIRISSVDAPAVLDLSNGPFTISVSFASLLKLYIHDAGGEQDSLEYGTAKGATDGLDAIFGEYELPPLPPTGVFDARWKSTGLQGLRRDVRDTLGGTHQLATYIGLLQPGAGFYPMTLKWNRLGLPAGSFILKDNPGGAVFVVDMKTQDSLVIGNSEVVAFQIAYSLGTTVSQSVTAGWSLLSVPLTVSDLRRSVLFPASSPPAYMYTPIGYVGRDTLANRSGYWMKFTTAQTLSMSGSPRVLDTINVVTGWNMIGSISSAVPVSSIVQVPTNIVASQYFGYSSTGYGAATTIDPMHGYWVKVTQSGKLILTGGAARLQKHAGGE
jgi:hypothetical protein